MCSDGFFLEAGKHFSNTYQPDSPILLKQSPVFLTVLIIPSLFHLVALACLGLAEYEATFN